MDGNGAAAARAGGFWSALPHQVVAHDRRAVELAFAGVHPEGEYRESQIGSLLSLVSLRTVEVAGMFYRLERMRADEAERAIGELVGLALDEESSFVSMLARDWEARGRVFEISCAALAAHLEVIRYRAGSNARRLGMYWPGDAWVAGMYRRAYAHAERSGAFWCDPLPQGTSAGSFMTAEGEVAVRTFFRLGCPDGLPPRKDVRRGNVTYAFGAVPKDPGTRSKAREVLEGKVFGDEGGK